MRMTAIAATAEPSSSSQRTCQCDCPRWAHAGWKVCQRSIPADRLTRLYFDDTTDPRGVYPRDVCPPCAEHIKSARSRGGEHLTTGPVRSAET